MTDILPMACSSKGGKIIELRLDKGFGKVVMYDGWEFSITPANFPLLQPMIFDSRVRLFSIGARIDWIDAGVVKPKNSTDPAGNIWTGLNAVYHINFQGSYHQDVAEEILQRCTSLLTCSFTYWSCQSFSTLIGKFASESLVELVAHVNGTLSTFDETIGALGNLADRTSCKLSTLQLIFSEKLSAEVVNDGLLFEAFGKLLAPGAKVCFLFQDEPTDTCMKKLLRDRGYVAYGYHYMAHNDPAYDDDFDKKTYELYRIGHKESYGIQWFMGCRKQPNLQTHVLSKDSAEDVYVIEGTYPLTDYKIVDGAEHHVSKMRVELLATAPPSIKHGKHVDAPSMKVIPLEKEKQCCEYISSFYFFEQPYCTAPVWKSSLVQKATHCVSGDVEFFTSNGFYFKVLYCSPFAFWRTMHTRATSRFILSSNNPAIGSAHGMEGCLISCETFELVGTWYSLQAIGALKCLQRSTNALVLMRMSIDKSEGHVGDVFNHLFCDLPWFSRGGMEYLYCDTRDADESRYEDFIHSLTRHNEPFPPFSELCIVIRKPPVPFEMVFETIGLHARGKTITLIFCKRAPEENIHMLTPEGFALIPRIYSMRSKYVDFNMRMEQFSYMFNDGKLILLMPSLV